MTSNNNAGSSPVHRRVRGAWVVNVVHVFLLLACAIGAIVVWGWFGPFAGTLWSVASFTFGVMFGLRLQRQAPNSKVSGAGTASAGLPGYASGDKNE